LAFQVRADTEESTITPGFPEEAKVKIRKR
jgi:hypothetical protein